jgi:hypothetical protein
VFVEINFQSGADFFDAHIEECSFLIQEFREDCSGQIKGTSDLLTAYFFTRDLRG